MSPIILKFTGNKKVVCLSIFNSLKPFDIKDVLLMNHLDWKDKVCIAAFNKCGGEICDFIHRSID